jgi:succinoglycan biosynthesis protein ExoO
MPAVPCLVSVITPIFNSAATLRRAAASALGQTLRDLELLIVDDGSTDESRSVAVQLAAADPRVRVIALPCNRGKSHALNAAIAEARGTWIAVLDADDRYQPDRLATLIAAGEAGHMDFVADNQFFFDAGARRIVGTALPETDGARELTRKSFAAGCDPYAAFDFGMLKPIVRAAFIHRAGVRYRERARLSEDFLFAAELLAAGGRGLLLNRPLYVWTQAFGSVSRRWTDSGGGAWRYDFTSAAQAHDEVRSELATRGEDAMARLLARRARAFRRLLWLSEVNRLRASRRVMAALLLLSRHPTVWLQVVRRACRYCAAHKCIPKVTAAWPNLEVAKSRLK